MGGVILTLSSSSPSMYQGLTDSLKSGMTDLVTNTLAMATVIIPVGLSIFGIYMFIGFAKKIFSKITGK